MVRSVVLIAALIVLSAAAGSAMAEAVSAAPAAPKKPVERPPLVGDACFGGKDENEADLLTGNEALVHQLLQQMLSPGS